ncbi:MAG: hypothetical protein ABSE95_19250 [Thermodesulfobacteriota bacterium]|jgi:hypothetical protein
MRKKGLKAKGRRGLRKEKGLCRSGLYQKKGKGEKKRKTLPACGLHLLLFKKAGYKN